MPKDNSFFLKTCTHAHIIQILQYYCMDRAKLSAFNQDNESWMVVLHLDAFLSSHYDQPMSHDLCSSGPLLFYSCSEHFDRDTGTLQADSI